MSRYIDAEAFLKEYCEPYPHVYMAMSKAMAEAPHIDIVRCKECVFRNQKYLCQVIETGDDDYCSYGERREP